MNPALIERIAVRRLHLRPKALFANVSLKGRLVSAYRAASVVLTSAAYLVLQPGDLLPYKLPVVCVLAITAWLLDAFYIAHETDRASLLLAIGVETAGIALLLLPTGGMGSPFLWYALNPALVAACTLPWWVCWADFGFFLAMGAAISHWLSQATPTADHLADSGTTVLVLALAVLALQLTAALARRREADAAQLRTQKEALDRANNSLTETNAQLNRTVDSLMSLYQAVVLLTSESEGNMAALFARYAARLCGGAAFYRAAYPGAVETFDAGTDIDPSALIGLDNPCSAAAVQLSGRTFLAAPVHHDGGTGLLGIEVCNEAGENDPQTLGLLEFLCGLYALVLDRQRARDSEERLAVAQEQNRIAGEIHDSVCQRLFSIACSAHSIAASLTRQGADETREQLTLLKECAGAANRELRSCIYHLHGSAGDGFDLFREVREYLRVFGRLNHLEIRTTLEGEGELSPERKRALSRILREACGNAVRHGRCSSLSVALTVDGGDARLIIMDDGMGFSPGTAISDGMGLETMRQTAMRAGGSLTVESHPGLGTVVTAALRSQSI